MKRLIECVPNFSEGRDPSKVDALVAAMSGVEGVWVLDRESDTDHNRSVSTLAGEPEAVAEAALRGVGKAAELIDLTRHTGAHPRLGATDVVPFIPIEGVTIEDCVVLAKKVGREIWERYRIPVYLYEAAALRPERTNLENIRRGQFEGLRQEVLANPDRAPDVGEPRLHPTAGATVVGARKFLIAYNINLNTPDIGTANKIAKTIRFSSGGLRYAKAMGVDLKARGLAQVSINLTDFEQTPIHRVFEMVKREAERYGCAIVGSEIVGLVPKKALEMAADFFLQLENFSPAQVLENKLADALSGVPMTSAKDGKLAGLARPFLDAVASPTATPGGGSVAAFAGALAASLGQMVAGLSRKKKSQASFVDQLSVALDEMRKTAEEHAAAIDRDAQAYDAVMAAFKLPQGNAQETRQRVEWRFRGPFRKEQHMKATTAIRRLGAAVTLIAVALAVPRPTRAGRLGADVIALFPKEVGEFAYVDLKKARSLKWFPQLQEQMIPERFRQFEKFLASAGVDPNSQVDELAWGLVAEGLNAKTEGTGSSAVPTGEEVVGVALGNYNPSSAEAYFKQQKLPTFKARAYTLYAFGTGSGPNDLFFFFLDSNTAAFGHREILEKMVEVRFGGEEGLLSNDRIFPLINEANGSGVVWAVLNPAYTRLAMQQLAPEVEQFPEAAKLVARMQNMIINVDAGSGIDGKFQAVCGSTEDANTLGQLLQAGFLYKRYQAQKDNPDLAQLLDQAKVTPGGDRVTIRMSLSDDQMATLIRKNTFALKM